MHLAFKALHEESCCAPYHNISSTRFQISVGGRDSDQLWFVFVLRLTQPRSRGQCWEPEPSQNRWRQSHIAIIWMGRSLYRLECSAAIAAFSHGTLKVKVKKKKKNITKQHSGPLHSSTVFIKIQFQCNFIHLISEVGTKILLRLNLAKELFCICCTLSFHSQLLAATVYLPVIRPTNSSLNSQPSVLNPFPAISGHVSLF